MRTEDNYCDAEGMKLMLRDYIKLEFHGWILATTFLVRKLGSLDDDRR